MDEFHEARVHELAVGDREPALERFERLDVAFGACGAGRSGQALVDGGVGDRVDARHEEARHRGDARNRQAGGDPVLETGEEGLDDRLVLRHREEQRDVHVDAGGERRADRREPCGRAGDLDHHVRAARRRPRSSTPRPSSPRRRRPAPAAPRSRRSRRGRRCSRRAAGTRRRRPGRRRSSAGPGSPLCPGRRRPARGSAHRRRRRRRPPSRRSTGWS